MKCLAFWFMLYSGLKNPRPKQILQAQDCTLQGDLMTDGIDIVSVNREKRDTGNFTIEDVAEYLQKKAKPDAKVYPLKIDQWVKAGRYQLYVKSLSGDMDDSWIHVIVQQDNSWLNWIVLPFAKLFSEPKIVVWWRKIPNTDLTLDVWYVGDGSGGVPLVFEANND